MLSEFIGSRAPHCLRGVGGHLCFYTDLESHVGSISIQFWAKYLLTIYHMYLIYRCVWGEGSWGDLWWWCWVFKDLKLVTSKGVYSLVGHQTQDRIISIYNVKWEESNTPTAMRTAHWLQSQTGLGWTPWPVLSGRGTWSFPSVFKEGCWRALSLRQAWSVSQS